MRHSSTIAKVYLGNVGYRSLPRAATTIRKDKRPYWGVYGKDKTHIDFVAELFDRKIEEFGYEYASYHAKTIDQIS